APCACCMRVRTCYTCNSFPCLDGGFPWKRGSCSIASAWVSRWCTPFTTYCHTIPLSATGADFTDCTRVATLLSATRNLLSGSWLMTFVSHRSESGSFHTGLFFTIVLRPFVSTFAPSTAPSRANAWCYGRDSFFLTKG